MDIGVDGCGGITGGIFFHMGHGTWGGYIYIYYIYIFFVCLFDFGEFFFLERIRLTKLFDGVDVNDDNVERLIYDIYC